MNVEFYVAYEELEKKFEEIKSNKRLQKVRRIFTSLDKTHFLSILDRLKNKKINVVAKNPEDKTTWLLVGPGQIIGYYKGHIWLEEEGFSIPEGMEKEERSQTPRRETLFRENIIRKSPFFRIKLGMGKFAKRWTSQIPKNDRLVEAKFIEFGCDTGSNTRKLMFTENGEVNPALQELPTLFVTAGGSWSIPHETRNDARLVSLQTWNWSGKVGGHVVVNPLQVIQGKNLSINMMPSVEPNFLWIQTYNGHGGSNTEFVLVKLDEDGKNVHKDHILGTELQNRISPYLREAEILLLWEDEESSNTYLRLTNTMYSLSQDKTSFGRQVQSLYRKIRRKESIFFSSPSRKRDGSIFDFVLQKEYNAMCYSEQEKLLMSYFFENKYPSSQGYAQYKSSRESS